MLGDKRIYTSFSIPVAESSHSKTDDNPILEKCRQHFPTRLLFIKTYQILPDPL